MRKILSLLSGIVLLTGCTTKPHAQIASNISQLAETRPMPIHLEPAGDVSGMELVKGSNGAEIAVREPGVYLVMFAPQVALIDPSKSGCFDSWIAINGTNVLDSGVKQCFNPQTGEDLVTAVLVGQVAQTLDQGDIISVWMSGNNTRTLYLPPNGEVGIPSVPSAIVTIIKL